MILGRERVKSLLVPRCSQADRAGKERSRPHIGSCSSCSHTETGTWLEKPRSLLEIDINSHVNSNITPTAKVPQLKVSSEGLEKPGIKPAFLGLQWECL